MDRRSFLNTLSASALLTAVAAIPSTPGQLVPASRSRISLNGEWEHLVDGKLYDTAIVPASRRPSGFYSLHRHLELPRLGPGERVFVHFEAVTYWARVSVNGQPLGSMGPYVPYEFEFTASAKEGSNEIQVQIADLVPFADGTAIAEIALGVHPGFEAYGGIIRDVWVELRPASFIENVRLAYELSDNYSVCSVRPRVMVSSGEAKSARVETVLRYQEAEVGRSSEMVQLKAGSNDIELAFPIKEVSTWSPETPNLYELTAYMKTDAAEDSWKCRTGFREIRAVGREFRLNGKRLVLNGICRHDMWKEQGLTLSRQQQDQDMRMIKSLGSNFVRLVHYPHDRHIIELADELGLLVSEEPGYWQMDFQTMERSRIELGYNILEAIIRRDWNSPSVMVWFLCNECNLTQEYLREGKQRCNRLDPIQRLVSAANDRDAYKVKPLFVGADLDFFDQHEYDFTLNEMDEEAQFDGPGKPLTFSEWGGKQIGQDQPIMGQTVDRLIDLVEAGVLSGHAFWSWQDLRQYSRIDGEMRDGILESGVVTEAREPRPGVWAELARLFAGHPHPRREETPESSRLTALPLRRIPFGSGNTFRPVDLQTVVDSDSGRQSWQALEASLEKYWTATTWNDQWRRTGSQFGLWQTPETKIAGVWFLAPRVDGRIRAVVLTAAVPDTVIPIHQACAQLHILGQVSFPVGYPLLGQSGETVALYTLQYANGKVQTLPVRNGIEVAQANCIDAATRIDPIATAAQPALQYIKDSAREQYQILLWSIPTLPEELVSMRCQLNGGQPSLAIFAITGEQLRK
ncbi:MAG: glycoside hydrolase family 2 TIM barrel-domain containing protein [Candidatus Acidiferrales bacterium]